MAAANNTLLPRRELIHRFQELAEEHIVFVNAPAGYGKTVAVTQWLERDSRSRAILALDELDNDMPGFCRRFSNTLLACQPANEKLAAIVAHDSFSTAPREFALRAIDALTHRKRSVLMIDDLHLLRSEATLQLLLIFLRRLPKNIQTVLISRADLPPGFSDLLIKGQAARVTASDLLFSEEDIRALCEKRGKPVSEELAEEISRLTHGWAIGVNAFLLSGGELSDDIYEYLDTFIAVNIWEKWDEDTREFMLRTAFLHDLDPSLCDALTLRKDSRALLSSLVQGGAFLTKGADGVFRYHHLFQSFLQRLAEGRGEDFRFVLLRIQGDWHVARHDFYSAADCFIRCRDHDGIARAFDLLGNVSRSDFSIERMLPIARNEEVRAAAKKYPSLLYTIGLCSYTEGNDDEMRAIMDEYYARFPEIAARNPECAHYILYMLFWDYRVPLGEMLSHVDFSLLPPASDVDGVNGSVTLYLPFLHRSSIDLSEIATGDVLENNVKLGAGIGWLFGEEWELLGSTIAAGLLYEKGDLARAHEFALAATAAIKSQFASDTKLSALAILAIILDDLGDIRGADLAMRRMSEMIEQDKAYFLSRSYAAISTSRKLRRGDVRVARSWLAEHAPDTSSRIYGNVMIPGLNAAFTTCKAFIVAGEPSSAMILLQKILTVSRAFHRPLDEIEALLLLAVAARKMRGLAAQAVRYLEEAVGVAYPYGYTQLFVQNGRELAAMLQKLWRKLEQTKEEDGVPAAFVKLLYLAAREARGFGLTSGAEEPSLQFTEKQLTVMRLLCEGMTYKEMCAELGIKLPTLRSHIELIYKKLDVASAHDAIAKIKAQGILGR